MYTTIIHPLRDHLRLSLREYCVLDSIYHLQNKAEYGFWCIASRKRIGDVIGVSERTVTRVIKTLLDKGYIIRGQGTQIRVESSVCDLFNHSKEVKGLAFYDEISIKMPKEEGGQNGQGVDKLSRGGGQSVQARVDKVATNINSNTNSNTISSKEERNPSPIEKKEYGNKDINQVLEGLRETIGCTDFKESQAWQRRYARNMLVLKKKLGRAEFLKRLKGVLDDEFKLKNCNSLKYLYGEIKSFIILS